MGAPAGPPPPATSADIVASAAASAPGAVAHEGAAGRTPHTSPLSHVAENRTRFH